MATHPNNRNSNKMKYTLVIFVMFFSLILLAANAATSILEAKAKKESAEKYTHNELIRDSENKANCAAGKGGMIYYKGVYCSK